MFLSKNISNRSAENLNFLASRLLGGMLISLLVLILARLLLVVSFVQDQFDLVSLNEKINFAILATRFDLKIVTIIYSLPLLLGLITFFNFTFSYFKKVFKIYNNVAIFLLTIFSVVNYFYFKTYDKSIDTFIFAISKEDPLAVIKTVINDYPVGFGLIGIIALVIIYKIISSKFYNYLDNKVSITENKKKLSIIITASILIFAMLMRGSFGTFPLRQLNAQVSDKPGVNYCLPSGVLAFYWAYKWEKESAVLPVVTPDEIVKAYKELGFDVNPNNLANLFEPLKKKTAQNEFLENHHPDIVFNVMESMSTHMLSFDDENSRDLLGELRKNFNEDMVFKNFISEGDGTSDSLTRMLVSSPDLNLSTSKYSNQEYICNIAKLFNKAGYETIFITASTASWRNYDNFLRNLGFARVIERSHVQKDFPHATAGAWGIDDEYLFSETYKVLKEKHAKPRFIMTLSITNHPPFRLPKDAEVQKVSLPSEILKRFPYSDTETIFATFRYANNQLGRFISKVKADDELRDNTFIAATGDHNMRGIGYTNHPDELVFGHEVPFYLYMPKQYIENTNVVYNKDTLGSQKDIITTLVSHAISDYEFFSFGCDMLSEDKCAFPYALNGSIAVGHDKDYACSILSPTGIAYKFVENKDSRMIVQETPDTSRNCKKEAALRDVEAKLYYLQALTPIPLVK